MVAIATMIELLLLAQLENSFITSMAPTAVTSCN